MRGGQNLHPPSRARLKGPIISYTALYELLTTKYLEAPYTPIIPGLHPESHIEPHRHSYTNIIGPGRWPWENSLLISASGQLHQWTSQRAYRCNGGIQTASWWWVTVRSALWSSSAVPALEPCYFLWRSRRSCSVWRERSSSYCRSAIAGRLGSSLL